MYNSQMRYVSSDTYLRSVSAFRRKPSTHFRKVINRSPRTRRVGQVMKLYVQLAMLTILVHVTTFCGPLRRYILAHPITMRFR